MALKFPDKIPSDLLLREFKWERWLEEGDTISVSPPPTIEARLLNGNAVTDPSDLVIVDPVGMVSTDGLDVLFYITNGVATPTTSTDYEIACTIHTNNTGEKVTRYATQKVKWKL